MPYLKSTEIYHIQEKRWENGPDLAEPAYSSALVTASSANFQAYLIGGNAYGDGLGNAITSVYAISKLIDRWIKIGDIALPRRYPVALRVPPSVLKECPSNT